MDFGEPQFDLIEPGRVSRGEVQRDVRALFEKGCDELGLVRREVVEDDVDLAAGMTTGDDLGEEADKFLARVARRRLAAHLASLRVQGGVERERAVALVLEAVALGASGRQRQHAVAAVERLNGGLFVDAEHGGVPRRVEVKADDVGGLGSKSGSLEAM